MLKLQDSWKVEKREGKKHSTAPFEEDDLEVYSLSEQADEELYGASHIQRSLQHLWNRLVERGKPAVHTPLHCSLGGDTGYVGLVT